MNGLAQIFAEMVAEAVASWRNEAAVMRRNGDRRGAIMARLHAKELEERWDALLQRPFTRSEAAELLGVAPDSVSRRTRKGTLPNAGRHHAPRYRLGDLMALSTHDRTKDLCQEVHRPHVVGATREQIVRAVVCQEDGDDG